MFLSYWKMKKMMGYDMKKIRMYFSAVVKNIYVRFTSKLVNKLVLLFSTVILLVIALQTIYSYHLMKTESIDNIVQSNYSNLEMVNKNMKKYLLDTEQFTAPLLNYGRLMDAVSEANNIYSSNIYLEDYIRNLFYSKKDIDSIFFYILKNNTCIYIVRNQNLNVRVNTMKLKGVQDTDWFQYLMQSGNSSYFQSLMSDNNIGYSYDKNTCFLAHHRALREITGKKCKAIITVLYNHKIRDEILKDIPLSSGEKIALFLDKEPLFYSNSLCGTDLYTQATDKTNERTGNSFYNTTSSGKEYMTIYNNLDTFDLKLAKMIPYAKINQSAKNIIKVNLTIGLVFFACSLILIIFLSNAISKPVKKLTKYVTAFGNGKLNKKFQVRGNDEIANLATQFNIMITKIDTLINSEYKLKLAEKNAVLKSLEAEINPHFLYNSLQAISTMALKRGADDVYDMINSLALIFRYCINNQDMVDIAQEIKHIENYLAIQKARFGSRLMVTYEIEDEALKLKIPKLSIQTLVENVIKHAIESTSKPIKITIQCYLLHDKFITVVKDNGPGISKETIKKIEQSFMDKAQDSHKIGLKNLYSRLKLIYGDKADLYIYINGGTEICFEIPMEK